MNRCSMCAAVLMLAGSFAAVEAQAPQTSRQNPTAQTTPAPTVAATQVAPLTLRGCVYKEKDVPGRTPNVAEKAGVMEDYILVADKDHSPAPAAPTAATGTTPPAPPAGTTGNPPMLHGPAYKLEKIADERLRAVLGKMIEVTGVVDAERRELASGASGTAAADRGVGPDAIDLPEFEVSSLKEVDGSCPAMPQIKK